MAEMETVTERSLTRDSSPATNLNARWQQPTRLTIRRRPRPSVQSIDDYETFLRATLLACMTWTIGTLAGG